MKNIIKVLGVITLMVVIGVSMTSCGEPVGTIEVTNDSIMQNDVDVGGVTVELYQGSTLIDTITGLQTTKTGNDEKGNPISFTKTKVVATFTDVPEGTYFIKVTDSGKFTVGATTDNPKPLSESSEAFTLAKDETKKLSYTGKKVEIK